MPCHLFPIHVNFEAARVEIDDRGVNVNHQLLKGFRYMHSARNPLGENEEDWHQDLPGGRKDSHQLLEWPERLAELEIEVRSEALLDV